MVTRSFLLFVVFGLLGSAMGACPSIDSLMARLAKKPTDKGEIDSILLGFYCHGGKPAEDKDVASAAVIIEDGKCKYAETYNPGEPVYDCCEQTGTCRGSSCQILGGATENGTSCDCLSCPCIECNWIRSSCFTADYWHKTDGPNGVLSERNGNTCFGKVRCKAVWDNVTNAWVRPDNCGDYRVGSYCIEDNVHFESKADTNGDGFDDGWFDSTMTTRNSKVIGAWNTTFKTCGWHLCDNNGECCPGQKCDLNRITSNLCPSCGKKNGTCTDDTPFIPTGNCPCDPKLRSEQCQATVTDHVGYTAVDVPNCNYDDIAAIKDQYGCEKTSPDCDTWVCTVAPSPEELDIIKQKLSACTPVIIQPVVKPVIQEP